MYTQLLAAIVLLSNTGSLAVSPSVTESSSTAVALSCSPTSVAQTSCLPAEDYRNRSSCQFPDKNKTAQCISKVNDSPSPIYFRRSECTARYHCAGFSKEVDIDITLAECLQTCGSHQWYTSNEFLTRVAWLLPILLLAGNLHLAPLHRWYQFFILLHLLGDPIDSILSLYHVLSVRHELDKWAVEVVTELQKSGDKVVRVDVRDLVSLASGLDTLQAISLGNILEQVKTLSREPNFPHAVRTVGKDLRTTTVTLILPTILAIFVFVTTITNEFVDAASSPEQKPGNRIAFTVLYSWMIAAALLSTTCHRFCESNSCLIAIQRFARKLRPKVAADLALDEGNLIEGVEEEGPIPAPWSGSIYTYRPEKLQWRSSDNLHFRRPVLAVALAILPVAISFTMAVFISYKTPTGEFTMRCIVQLAVFVSWLFSFFVTTVLNSWSIKSSENRNVRGKFALQLIYAKDFFIGFSALFMVLLVTAGMLNSCLGWSNGISGLVWGTSHILLTNHQALLQNLGLIYPISISLAIGAQVLLFLVFSRGTWQRSWSRFRLKN